MSVKDQLKNTTTLSLDKQFYFADRDYADYRELVCHERPYVFVLRYYFGEDFVRPLLLDRGDFGLDAEGRLIPRSHMLRDFLIVSGLMRPLSFSRGEQSLAEITEQYCSERNAVVVPTATVVAGHVVPTSVYLEGRGTALLKSSLRGDDFYVRRQVDATDLEDSLFYKGDDLRVDLLEVPSVLMEEGSEGRFATVAKEYAFKNLNLNRADKIEGGSAALQTFLQASERLVPDRVRDVEGGFHNVLLAKVLWPITFCIRPYLIGLKWAVDEGLYAQELGRNIQEVVDLSEVSSNVGLLFGKSPNLKTSNRFFRAVERVIESYIGIEEEVRKK